eukprot:CAMPEP_0180803388 /NCGR_PEP_ID=MMETSP1038_2-20121128/60871_1 /TAXON_ID=632150 /ORGANISM="Azadinium spinosum, Strain 3D9" /LENGTH=63 /DNA_ID=CAMNT_0022843701 /DNA_START=79 /DNA_END=267 /DNA_ORIENTATION=-
MSGVESERDDDATSDLMLFGLPLARKNQSAVAIGLHDALVAFAGVRDGTTVHVKIPTVKKSGR